LLLISSLLFLTKELNIKQLSLSLSLLLLSSHAFHISEKFLLSRPIFFSTYFLYIYIKIKKRREEKGVKKQSRRGRIGKERGRGRGKER